MRERRRSPEGTGRDLSLRRPQSARTLVGRSGRRFVGKNEVPTRRGRFLSPRLPFKGSSCRLLPACAGDLADVVSISDPGSPSRGNALRSGDVRHHDVPMKDLHGPRSSWDRLRSANPPRLIFYINHTVPSATMMRKATASRKDYIENSSRPSPAPCAAGTGWCCCRTTAGSCSIRTRPSGRYRRSPSWSVGEGR